MTKQKNRENRGYEFPHFGLKWTSLKELGAEDTGQFPPFNPALDLGHSFARLYFANNTDKLT